MADLGVREDQVFVPAQMYVRGHKRVLIYLMQGYVFVESGLPETAYFRLERRSYVNQVMSSSHGEHGMRSLHVVPHKEILSLRAQLHDLLVQEVIPGSYVSITDGTFHGLSGLVCGVAGEHALVEIIMRSLHLLVSVPRAFIDMESEEPPPVITSDPVPLQPPEKATPPPPPMEPMIKARDLFDDVISALGFLSRYKHGAGVERGAVIDEVMRGRGWDKELPRGWVLEGLDGVYRRIGWAFRNQRAAYTQRPLTLMRGRGSWGLTRQGVREAQALNRVSGSIYFREALLKSLWSQAGGQAGVFVDMQAVLRGTLSRLKQRAESKPDRWIWGGRQGIQRKITLQFRSLKDSHPNRPALTVQGSGPGLWGLTPEGVDQARLLLDADQLLI